jgi:hypothetical protein
VGISRLESRAAAPTLIAAISTAKPEKKNPPPNPPAGAELPGEGADGPSGEKGTLGPPGVRPEEREWSERLSSDPEPAALPGDGPEGDWTYGWSKVWNVIGSPKNFCGSP